METTNTFTVEVTIITKAKEVEWLREVNASQTQSLGALEKLNLVLGSDESKEVITATLNDIIKELLDADDVHVNDLKQFVGTRE